MSNWLAALGDAALAGSELIGRRRAEKIAEQERQKQQQMQQLQMALMMRDQQLQEQQFGMKQDEAKREKALQLRQLIGPNGVLDDVAAKSFEDAGLGSLLQKQEGTLSSKQFMPAGIEAGEMQTVDSPGLQAGNRVIPTAAEQTQITTAQDAARERSTQQKYQSIIESPAFFAQPYEKRQMVWNAAGYQGKAPETPQEQKDMLDYEHKLRMQEIGAQTAWHGPPGAKPAQAPGYSTERAQRTVDMIDAIIPQVSNWTAGPLGLLSPVPGTPQHNLSQAIEALGANIAFSELTEMREASKTGGALGNISNVELELLRNAMGSIKQTQDPTVLVANLQKIKASVQRWQQAKQRYGFQGPQSGAPQQPMGPPAPDAVAPAATKPKFTLIPG